MLVAIYRKILRRNRQRIRNPSEIVDFRGILVRVERFERSASWTQIKRATNCAIPGYLILNHYSTKLARLKDFSVCGHSCGQSRFCAAFGNRGKSRKRRRRKVLRRFAMTCPGYRHGAPKTVCGNFAYYTSFLRVLQEGETLRMGGICRTTIHIEQEYNTRHGLQAIQWSTRKNTAWAVPAGNIIKAGHTSTQTSIQKLS